MQWSEMKGHETKWNEGVSESMIFSFIDLMILYKWLESMSPPAKIHTLSCIHGFVFGPEFIRRVSTYSPSQAMTLMGKAPGSWNKSVMNCPLSPLLTSICIYLSFWRVGVRGLEKSQYPSVHLVSQVHLVARVKSTYRPIIKVCLLLIFVCSWKGLLHVQCWASSINIFSLVK